MGNQGAADNTVSFDELSVLKHSLDPAYRTGARFMFNDNTLGVLERLKDGDGRPIWLPSVNVEGPSPGTIWGHPYTINQDMPAITVDGIKGLNNDGAAATLVGYSVAFGQFMNYLILDAMGSMELHRLDDSSYTKRRVIGFLMYMRTAAKVIDVSGGQAATALTSAIQVLNNKAA